MKELNKRSTDLKRGKIKGIPYSEIPRKKYNKK